MSLPGDQSRDPSIAVPRAIVMAVVVVLAFSVVVARLWSIQIQQGEDFRDKSLNNFIQFKRLEHARGEILDREGRVLVTNRPSLNVYVTPAFFPDTKRMVQRLGVTVGLDKLQIEDVSEALNEAVRAQKTAIMLARGVSAAQARAVRKLQDDLEIALEAVPIIAMPAGGPAAEEPRYVVYLDPAHFPSTTRILRRLRDLLDLGDKDMKLLRRRIARARGLDRYLDIIVRRDVPPDAEGTLSLLVQLGELPGVTVRRANAREYPHGTMAAHVLGYVNELSPNELEERRAQGYRLGDAIGRRGVERTFEDELRGTDGRETVVVDSKGRSQRSRLADALMKDVGVFEPPTPGNRVVLTLDLDMQRAADAAFQGKAGAVVMLEVKTGRILAMTSTPSFNPQFLSGYFDPVEKKRLDAMSALKPWRFRAIQDFFAPGSTFKVVTALAALKAGVTHATERINCPGAFRLGNVRWRCWKESGHGPTDLPLSLARSCDVYYYTMGARLGLNPIAQMGRDLGFGDVTQIPLAPESKGIMPDERWYARREGYTLGAAVNASIGQGAVSVTPLQLAVAYGAIANGGTVYRPQIALRIETYDGRESREVPPEAVRRLAVPPEHLAIVREGLRQVVNEPFGTAYYRRSKLLAVSGKTGTAQVARMGAQRVKSADQDWEVRDHAWFAAIAPSEAPEIAVVAFVEHGGGGSSMAAPVAMATIDAWWTKKTLQAGLPQAPLTVAVVDEDEHVHLHDEEVAWRSDE
jgi:penicillin-binding protein 2